MFNQTTQDSNSREMGKKNYVSPLISQFTALREFSGHGTNGEMGQSLASSLSSINGAESLERPR